jgi:hypothetical protein
MAPAPDLSLCSMTSLLYVYGHQDNLKMHNGLLKFWELTSSILFEAIWLALVLAKSMLTLPVLA